MECLEEIDVETEYKEDSCYQKEGKYVTLKSLDVPLGPDPSSTGNGPPGPPMPRPVLPRERGYFDRFVEYLVGDGPANRFALVCRQCESHNGMALKDEFPYLGEITLLY